MWRKETEMVKRREVVELLLMDGYQTLACLFYNQDNSSAGLLDPSSSAVFTFGATLWRHLPSTLLICLDR